MEDEEGGGDLLNPGVGGVGGGGDGDAAAALNEGLFLACPQRTTFELQRVPPRERESALDDVWGRRTAQEQQEAQQNQPQQQQQQQEDSQILEQMQRHVTQHRIKPAFFKVFFLNPMYAYNMGLLKLFYRPEDPKRAAQEYCQHWDLKLKYFGLEQLPKPLSMKESLLPQDKACLYSGAMQLFRDDHGRIVLCLLPSLLSKQQANGNSEHSDDCPHLVRAMWYILFRAMQERNERGIVIVLIGQDREELFSKTILSSNSVLSQALPMEILAVHMIDGHDIPPIKQQQQQNKSTSGNNNNNGANANANANNDDDGSVASNNNNGVGPGAAGDIVSPNDVVSSDHHMDRVEEAVGRLTRLRLRQHNMYLLYPAMLTAEGDNNSKPKPTPLEFLQERLQKFGISYLPINPDGSLVMNNPLEQCNSTKKTTTTTTTSSTSTKRSFFFQKPEWTLANKNNIIIPTPQDVLLGRGRPFQEFPGNMALNDALDANRKAYQQATSRRDKTNLSQKILTEIQKKGGRFLMQQQQSSGEHWIVVKDLKAREKIAHGFRMPRKQAREEIQQQQQQQLANKTTREVQGAMNNAMQVEPAAGAAGIGGGGANDSSNRNNRVMDGGVPNRAEV
eukprot:scaffold6966_cov112-Cylindrotheca_fusiformis.AAC.8